jgi:pyruvate formate lyase activating enzyme
MNTANVVFNIQRFSLHDGPGIRTTVFLKGCSMRCYWCHNPEGQHPEPELRYYPERCIACGQCVISCPNQAHEMHDGSHVFLRDMCELSGKCVETCYPRALQMEGRVMTVGQVMDEVLLDRPFYESSGGGVTLSGGEPALTEDFAREILRRCKDNRLHTAIETCGEVPWTSLETLLPFTDMIMADIKHLDSIVHQRATGQPNDRILSNARRLAISGKAIIFRTPVVPSVNDTEEEITRIATFVRELIELSRSAGANGSGEIRYELLTFHKLAAGKYQSLGLDYKARDAEPLTKARMTALLDAARRSGVNASLR